MKTNTILLLGLGGAAAYALLRKKGPDSDQGGEGGSGGRRFRIWKRAGLKGPRGGRWPKGDAFDACKTGDFSIDDIHKINDAVTEAIPKFADTWTSAGDAKLQAHDVAVYVLASLCPSWPVPKGLYNVPQYIETYGPKWEELYSTANQFAFNTIIGA